MSQQRSAPTNRNQLRKLAIGIFLVAMICAAGAARSDGPTSNEIRIDVLGLRNDKGVVGCLLFSSADGYPNDPAKATQKIKSIIEHGRAACVFDDPRPGTYAVSFMHDENENGQLDTNFIGIPSEGFGASNDARGTLGPPKFEDAKFDHALGLQTLQLHTKYF